MCSLKKAFTLLIIFITVCAHSRDFIEPLVYPNETVTNPRPNIIWQDNYKDKPGFKSRKFRITIKNDDKKNGKEYGYIVYPEPIYDQFLLFRMPQTLPGGSYSMKIEKLHRGKPVKDRRYYYLHYPARESFVIDSTERRSFDYIEPRFQIAFDSIALQQDRYSDDALISLGAATGSAGMGYLFYTFLGGALWGQVLAAICFISAGTGYGASGYFAGKALSLSGDKDRVLEIAENEEEAGKYDGKRLKAEFQLKF